MSPVESWLIILGGMVVTYFTRLSFTVLVPPDRLSPTFSRGLVFIPPAVLAAIILPELLLVEGNFEISLVNFQLVAGVIASLVAWRTKNTWLTISSGMLALWMLLGL
ncbi:MAG: AzlD domain-containing protein [Anaerolineales bacterium]